jgi:uncharacterized protein (DUF305 family)
MIFIVSGRVWGQSKLRRITWATLGLITLSLSMPLAGCMKQPQWDDTLGDTSTSTSAGGIMHHGNHGSVGHAMDLGPADADYDLRFIDAMIPHHEGALVMAEQALQNSQRPEIKALANAILQTQAAEIEQMQAWRKSWYPDAPDTPMAWHTAGNHMMPMTESQRAAMRMDMSLGAADADFDRRFLDAMIVHHEAAVVMAQDLQTKSTRPEMKQLATDIIAAQQQEITQMKAWKESW